MKKILIADDDNDFRAVLKNIIEREGFVVFDASNGTQTLDIFKTFSPHLIILDLEMPGLTGLETIKAIREMNPLIPIIFLSGRGSIPSAVATLKMGALDFICKPPDYDVLINLILSSLEKQSCDSLTNRELNILGFIKEGKTNQQIGSALNISNNTVCSHTKSILQKLKASSRAQAIAIAIKKGLIPSSTCNL